MIKETRYYSQNLPREVYTSITSMKDNLEVSVKIIKAHSLRVTVNREFILQSYLPICRMTYVSTRPQDSSTQM